MFEHAAKQRARTRKQERKRERGEGKIIGRKNWAGAENW